MKSSAIVIKALNIILFTSDKGGGIIYLLLCRTKTYYVCACTLELVCLSVCLSVCLTVCKITQKRVNGFG